MGYQTGWMQEIEREGGWTSFKLYWREKDANGKWNVKSRTLPREMNGKPVVRKDAQKVLDGIAADVNSRNGEAPAMSGVTFEAFLDSQWTDYVKRNKLRDSTLDGYKSMLDKWIKPHFGALLVTNISKETVSQFFRELRSENLADKTQKNLYSLLVKIFDLAIAADLIKFSPVNVTLHRPHVSREEKQTLPVEKVQAFFEALPVEWRTLFTVLLLTGMRQGELLGLRWQDLDFRDKKILKRNVIYRGRLVAGLKDNKRTGKAREHKIGMSPLVETLLNLRATQTKYTGPENFVFCRDAEEGKPLCPDHIRRYVLYPAMETAKIPMKDRENGLHMFRHTVVSELAKRKGLAAAQHQVGHSSINTTANIYNHVDAGQVDDSALALESAFATHLLPLSPSPAAI